MAERVYPSAKPNGTTSTATTSNPASTHPPPPPPASQFAPPIKPHLYNPNRPAYRPTPTSHHRHNHRRCSGRRCCFFCCCWFIIFLIFIILLSCIAVAAVYFLYHPKTPSFSISSLKITQFNLTTTTDDTTRLTAKFNLTISSKNPNKKITVLYDPITISSYTRQILLANGSFPSFASSENNVTIIHTTLFKANQLLDVESVKDLNSDLKKKIGLPIKLVLETKVKVKIDDKIKVRKFGILITCEGIHVRGLLNKGKDPLIATATNDKCKVDLRFKIWKFTF